MCNTFSGIQVDGLPVDPWHPLTMCQALVSILESVESVGMGGVVLQPKLLRNMYDFREKSEYTQRLHKYGKVQKLNGRENNHTLCNIFRAVHVSGFLIKCGVLLRIQGLGRELTLFALLASERGGIGFSKKRRQGKTDFKKASSRILFLQTVFTENMFFF